MRPQIANFVRDMLYPELEDDTSVRNYPNVRGISKDVFFMSHEKPEDGNENALATNSASNQFEAEMVVSLLRYILRQGYNMKDCVILTPYVGQLMKIRKLLQKEVMVFIDDRDAEQIEAMKENDDDEECKSDAHVAKQIALNQGVRVATVDNFQGEEADIIIISLVRSGSEKNKIGFLRTSNRVNVLLSRAKQGMYLVGNHKLFCAKSEDVWRGVIDNFERQGYLGDGFPLYCCNHPEKTNVVSDPDMLRLIAPDGGCLDKCKAKLAECGHVCPYSCHSDYKDHRGIFCPSSCTRLRDDCQHPCPKVCGELCGNCEADVGDVCLPCGHNHPNTMCYQAKGDLADIQCRVKVKKVIPTCGHEVNTECHRDPKSIICLVPCGILLDDCSHPCQSACGKCVKLTIESDHDSEFFGIVERTEHPACRVKCEKALSCKHYCRFSCHFGKDCPPCLQQCDVMNCEHSKCTHACSEICQTCKEVCSWKCEHFGECPALCGAPCLRLPCDRQCEKLLPCGHQCPSVCGEICPSSEFCRECNEAIKATVVDFIMMETYGEVDLNKNPIVVLDCNHFFTMETLDGTFEFSKVYKKLDDGSYTLVLPDSSALFEPPSCPSCRARVSITKRYGRVIKLGSLTVARKKYITLGSKMVQGMPKQLENALVLMNKVIAKKGKKEVDLSSVIHPIRKVQQEISNFNRFVQSPPDKDAYEGTMSNLSRLGLIDQYNSVLPPEPYQMFKREGVRMQAYTSHKLYEKLAELANAKNGALAKEFLDRASQEQEKALKAFDDRFIEHTESSAPGRSRDEVLMFYCELQLAKVAAEWHKASTSANVTVEQDAIKKKIKDLQNTLERFMKGFQSAYINDNQERIQQFLSGIDRLEKQGTISKAELKIVFQAMTPEIGTSGHWYECVNGHPVSYLLVYGCETGP
jgi:hypothetical protein